VSTRHRRAALPYENSSSGERALVDMQRILTRFDVESFGSMCDFERKVVIVQFRHHGVQISMEASIAGYAAAWLRVHPWSRNSRRKREEHEQEALRVAQVATYSVLRDWIKGQITAVETGILSFEGAFLGQIMLPSGATVLDYVQQNKMLGKGAA
jgi:hypothetical protein